MKKRFYFLAFAALASLGSCQEGHSGTDEKRDEESVLSLLYQQQAAEYHALCLQAYNLASRQIDVALAGKGKHKPFAVVTDLDETALDNSPEEVMNYQNDTTYSPAAWNRWAIHGKPGTVPGALAFFNYAKSKGIHIYYVSNRDASDSIVNATMARMDTLGFPFCKASNKSNFLFLPKNAPTSSKEPRRQAIAKTDSIIVLLGDNLIDLDKAFDKVGKLTQTNQKRIREVDSLRNRWGSRYIVFPNAVYGDWEQALYDDYLSRHPGAQLNQKLKDSLRRSLLRTFKY